MESKENGQPINNFEENEIIMINGISYKFNGYNPESKRFFIELSDDNKNINLEKNQMVNIKNQWYVIHYIHNTKKRITLRKK